MWSIEICVSDISEYLLYTTMFIMISLTRLVLKLQCVKYTMGADALDPCITRWSAAIVLTYCGLVTPYDDNDLGQHWLR